MGYGRHFWCNSSHVDRTRSRFDEEVKLTDQRNTIQNGLVSTLPCIRQRLVSGITDQNSPPMEPTAEDPLFKRHLRDLVGISLV